MLLLGQGIIQTADMMTMTKKRVIIFFSNFSNIRKQTCIVLSKLPSFLFIVRSSYYEERAPSERTLSEYTTYENERTSSPPQAPARKSRSDRSLNAGPKNLGPTYGPPSRLPPRAPSALSFDHGGDTGSDIYVSY